MKTILITGATSGIGLAAAKKLANSKNNLILCGRRQHKLDEISNELSKITNVLPLCFDVSNKKEVNKVLEKLNEQTEVKALMDALNAQFIRPVPGGDLMRSPDIVPTGRNIHAFDPFRMPSLFAMKEGEQQAELLSVSYTHLTLPTNREV